VNFPDYKIECFGKIYRPSHGSGVWSSRCSEEIDRFCDDVTLSVFLRLKGTGHTNTTDSRIPQKSSWEDVPAEVGAWENLQEWDFCRFAAGTEEEGYSKEGRRIEEGDRGGHVGCREA
jgi:hypothetical protein